MAEFYYISKLVYTIKWELIIIIIKITISSILIGLKNSYFPLVQLPSCYRTVHIESCSLTQPISISGRHETIYPSFVSILLQIFPFFHNLSILLSVSRKYANRKINQISKFPVIKKRTPAAQSSDFAITHMTTDRIELHSVLLPLHINIRFLRLHTVRTGNYL